VESTYDDFTANWRASIALDVELTADLESALDKLKSLNASDGRFRGRFALNQVGVFGHSYGGSHALRALRSNPTIAAAANLDGSLFAEDYAKGVNKPYLTLSSADSNPTAATRAASLRQLQASGLSAEQAQAVLERGLSLRPAYEASAPAYYVSVRSARHLNFSDVGLWDAYGVPADRDAVNVADARAILDLQGALLETFFDRHLMGRLGKVSLPNTALPDVTLDERR
jgi:dienelactone hydrolase